MELKNNSNTRPYYVGSYVIAPQQTQTVPDTFADAVAGIEDLEVVKAKPAKAATKATDKDAE